MKTNLFFLMMLSLLVSSCQSKKKMTKEEVSADFCNCLTPKVKSIGLLTVGLLGGAVLDDDPSDFLQRELKMRSSYGSEIEEWQRKELLSVIDKSKGSILGDCVDNVTKKYGKQFSLSNTTFLTEVVQQMKLDTSCRFPSIILDFANKVR